MAIVVPILLSATGVAGTIAAATGIVGLTGTMVSTIVSVAFQVTGVNDKINKAASKVFGEDLVKVVNIAGAVYGAVNGGFEFADAASAATDASSAMAVNGSDFASDAFSAANAADKLAGGTGLVSDGIGTYGGSLAATDPSSALAINGMDAASDGFSAANKAAGGGMASDGFGTNLLRPDAALGQDPKAAMNVVDRISTPSVVTDAPASAAKASASQPLKAANASDAVQPPSPPTPPKLASAPPAAIQPGSFFDKLKNAATSEKGLGLLVQGVGSGLATAANNRTRQEELEFQKKLRSVPTLYVKGAQA